MTARKFFLYLYIRSTEIKKTQKNRILLRVEGNVMLTRTARVIRGEKGRYKVDYWLGGQSTCTLTRGLQVGPRIPFEMSERLWYRMYIISPNVFSMPFLSKTKTI